ncbi:MAG: isochorismatase family protein [Chloroflexi bacterium]|nr:isochorismatase family protein [Chloroflexota bacterium]
MKERYFSRESIHQKSIEMLDQIKEHKQKHHIAFVPGHSALLVLDMQKYFLSDFSHAYIPSAQAIVPGIKDLIKAYSAKGLPVIFTQHVNSPQNAGLMAKWWRDLIREEDPLSDIIGELNLSSGTILKKSQYDAFYETPLADILRKKEVTQVVICGVMTNLCCETTARSAFVRGFEVFFPIDGTATYNEEFHLATLLNLSHGFATPVLVEEILDHFAGRR